MRDDTSPPRRRGRPPGKRPRAPRPRLLWLVSKAVSGAAWLVGRHATAKAAERHALELVEADSGCLVVVDDGIERREFGAGARW